MALGETLKRLFSNEETMYMKKDMARVIQEKPQQAYQQPVQANSQQNTYFQRQGPQAAQPMTTDQNNTNSKITLFRQKFILIHGPLPLKFWWQAVIC